MLRSLQRGLFLAGLWGSFLISGCTIESYHLSDSWETQDKFQLKRTFVLVQAPPGTPAHFVELAGRIARRYVNLKKDFLVLGNAPAQPEPVAALAETDGHLLLDFTEVHLAQADDLRLRVTAQLLRNPGRGVVWKVVASRSDEPANEDLSRLTQRYVRELGDEVEPYVAPTFILMKRVFDTLPSPQLTDEDIEAKIMLDD